MVDRQAWWRSSVVLAAIMAVTLAGCARLGPEQGPKAAGHVSQGIPSIDRDNSASSNIGRIVSRAQNGKIAFTSNRGGSSQIWVMNPDGSGQTQLTSAFHQAQLPSWSRDGTKIAFVGSWPSQALSYTGRPFTDQLYVMNADGSNQKLLTTEWFANGRLVSNENAPTWSPDGQMIAFQSHSLFHHPLNKPPHVIRADGSGLARLPDGMHNMDWSPDGKRFVYDFNGRGIRIANAPLTGFSPGSDAGTVAPAVELTTKPGDRNASWSLDGNRIVFNRSPNGDGSAPNVFVMKSDGSALTNLTANFSDSLPEWSPDGTKIAFAGRAVVNNEDILVMNANGTGRVRLTTDAGLDHQPSWQLGKRWFAEPVIDLPMLEKAPPPIAQQAASQAINPCLFGFALPWTC